MVLKKISFELGGRMLTAQVQYSRRQSIGLGRKDGSFYLKAPIGIPEHFLYDMLAKHRDWMEKVLKAEQEQQENTEALAIPALEDLSREEVQQILDNFSVAVECWAKKMGITYGNITVRNQRTRWGSCSSKGNLNFNYRLHYLPVELMDYVIIHELAHRRHMNHSAAFYQEVARYCPNYKECEAQLKKIGIK